MSRRNFDEYLDQLDKKYDRPEAEPTEPVPPEPVQRNTSQNTPKRGLPPRRQPGQPVKINNHFIAPRKKGLEGMVRDHSKISLEVFERNLAKRKGY